MGALIDQLGSFIAYIYSGVEQVIDFVLSLFGWVASMIVAVHSTIGTVCPSEIALVVAPVLVSMFAFLGIKLLVRLL